MSTKTRTRTVEQITATLTLRIPRGTSKKTLAENAQARIERIPIVSNVTLHALEGVKPRGGVVLATVTGTIEIECTDDTTQKHELRAALSSSVSVETIESLTKKR